MVAVVAIIGLTVAVILLATSQNGTPTVATPARPAALPVALPPPTHHVHGRPNLDTGQTAAAQIGATLNHRGSDTSQTAAAQIGATLNHRGSDTSQTAAAQIGARLNHRGS